MWFAQNEVDQFTVSLWFKRDGIQSGLVGLVNNGDCEEDPNFEVTASPNGIYSGVTTGTQTLTNKVQVRRKLLSLLVVNSNNNNEEKESGRGGEKYDEENFFCS